VAGAGRAGEVWHVVHVAGRRALSHAQAASPELAYLRRQARADAPQGGGPGARAPRSGRTPSGRTPQYAATGQPATWADCIIGRTARHPRPLLGSAPES
jgi:hypothetical protein